ncbi:MAG TPA: permease-like cell division protein FtsX [Euzebyales bacterium]|nr:permease-like cell division protein FtsX [Euzebyales bacterium]
MAPRWRYLLAEVGIGLRRNPLMTLATVVTVTVSLALLGVGMLIKTQVDFARSLLFQEVEVSIFLEDDLVAQEQQRADFEAELRGNSEVEQVVYESKEEAYEKAQEIFANDQALLDSLGPDDLPASFRVSLVDPERFDVVRSQYIEYPGVQDITDQRETLDRFFNLMNSVRRGAVAVAVLQLVAAAALISNTIRMTAFARRDQTGIMKLVGATNWYIRMPFMIEGVAAGVAGALLAGGLLLAGMATIVSGIRDQIQFLPLIGINEVVMVMPWLVMVGGGIAAIASFLSLRRFLDV